MPERPVIVWFRNDLRLADHAALHAAIETKRPVLPVFVLDEAAAGAWSPGGASNWWLHHSLTSLAHDLRARGAPLILRRGTTQAVLRELLNETGADCVCAGHAVEPWARKLEAELVRASIPLQLHRTVSLFDPASLHTKAGSPFLVYTPFSRAALATGGPPPPLAEPARISGVAPSPRSDALADWALLPTKPDWAGGLREMWQPGEDHARRRLRSFVSQSLADYAGARDQPGVDGTSRLSPHLHFGEISAAQVWHEARDHGSAAKFINELLWREFSLHLLWHHPHLPDRPLREAFAAMPWRRDQRALRDWQRGETGIPIVDAGMRQLWHTGWMHNRVRMIVASFLVKHLLIHWRDGEAWFWDTLVDADLPNNSANWQWIAGCGADAAPYFRIFNPVLQGRKFDPDGDYVRAWVRELARLDAKFIHAPWDTPEKTLAEAGVVLGRSYPKPIVDLAEGRARALRALASIGGALPHAAAHG